MQHVRPIVTTLTFWFVALSATLLSAEGFPQIVPPESVRERQRAEFARDGGFATWVYGRGNGPETTHGKLQKGLLDCLAAIDFVCELRPDQKRQLELIGKGDIQNLFDEIDRLAAEIQIIKTDPALVRQFREKHASLPARIRAGPRGDSLLVRSIEGLLTGGQAVRYAPLGVVLQNGGAARLTSLYGEPGLALDLADTSIGDAELARIATLPKIRFLSMRRTKVTDAGLARLPPSGELWALDLESTDVADAGLAGLCGFPNLRTLVLDGTGTTDAALPAVADLKLLVRLSLARTQVTDAGLSHLGGLTRLRSLSLNRTGVTDAGLGVLSGLTAIDYLGLQETAVTDTGLRHIRPLTGLVQLYLDGTKVTDAGLPGLAELKELGTLGLKRTMVTPRGVEDLQALLPKVDISVAR